MKTRSIIMWVVLFGPGSWEVVQHKKPAVLLILFLGFAWYMKCYPIRLSSLT